jgi:NAD(P)-dependent dehydrogenase (short-subunit alcohol dehydrogenase family)
MDKPALCAVVAGASSGIGRGVAQRLLAEGWHVALLARRAERLRDLARSAAERVLAVACDLTNETQVRAAAREIAAWQPEAHALINSVGDFLVRPLAQTSVSDFEGVWRVNVLSKFLATRELLSLLLKRESNDRAPRAVIHVSSLAAHHDFPDESAYASAMHAIIGLARSQDAELRERGIRVAVISPGLVRTELTERSGFSEFDLARALSADGIATSAWYLISTIRSGGYVPEIVHVPG